MLVRGCPAASSTTSYLVIDITDAVQNTIPELVCCPPNPTPLVTASLNVLGRSAIVVSVVIDVFAHNDKTDAGQKIV